MKVNCFGCGIEKDTNTLELSPWAEQDGLYDGLISPLFVLDCQGDRISNDPNRYSEYRQVVVCHYCFHALEPDMWISKSCWENINPKIPYEKCPLYVADRYDPALVEKELK